GAGAGQSEPAAVGRVIDAEREVGAGVIRHVGSGALGAALGDHAVLIARLTFIEADAAAAAVPGGLAGVIARTVEVQVRAADTDHVRGNGGILRRYRRAGVAAGRDEGHARVTGR